MIVVFVLSKQIINMSSLSIYVLSTKNTNLPNEKGLLDQTRTKKNQNAEEIQSETWLKMKCLDLPICHRFVFLVNYLFNRIIGPLKLREPNIKVYWTSWLATLLLTMSSILILLPVWRLYVHFTVFIILVQRNKK